ncbi:MAG: hypothetical protein B6I36_10275 [Desulfobacteraceae bacterium 4572_35.1]|nr:MAG: hypothetical protein B6I36_10275 [Desulfobacteraceae bacterium 4572_35.1]
MNYVFAGSIPAKGQVEKLRLTLSTYQDGTGQLVFELGKSLPGWRDFERSVALAFAGIAQESKAIFDVLVPISENPEMSFGISCKMRETLRTVERTGRVTVEVSNSSGKFWDALGANGIDDYDAAPDTAGKILLNLVESWHNEVSLEQGGTVDVSKSFYLLLQWHKRSSRYQLFQFPTHLPDPETLSWKVEGRRLVGRNNDGVMIEWYGYSGGQLKYYPFADNAIWSSDIFQLEPLPENDLGYGLRRRVIEYFPDLWRAANEM